MNIQVKIYDAAGDIGKKWYAYYFSPSGKMVKVYKGINVTNDPTARHHALKLLASSITKGKHIRNIKHKNNLPALVNEYLSRKRLTLKNRSYQNIKKCLYRFVRYCSQNNINRDILKNDIDNYCFYLLRDNCSNRTVNNYISELNTFFSDMVQCDNYLYNPCEKRKPLITRSQRNTPFTDNQFKNIVSWCAANDTTLLAYILIMGYMLMRPSELLTVKVCDIDFNKMEFWLRAAHVKNNRQLLKRIPEILFPYFEKYKSMPGNYYLFGLGGDPNNIPCGINNFSKRFRKMRNAIGIPTGWNLYSIKHTFATNMVINGAKDFQLMGLTGHRDLQSINVYIKSIGAIRPIDTTNYVTLLN